MREDIILNISTSVPKVNNKEIKNKKSFKDKQYLNKKRELKENENNKSSGIIKKPQIKSSEFINNIDNFNLPDISFKKDEKYNPFSIKLFSELNLNQYLLKQLIKNNYEQLTKIQKQAIPILLEHKNVLIKSETGTGKTLAYVIPLYEHLIKTNLIKKIDRKDGVYCVIFAPTHELCIQIENCLNKLNSCCIGIVHGTLIGGQKIDIEKLKIRKGLNIIICTPGRLLYHLKNSSNLIFNNLSHIIFDEADVLLEMGYEKDIKESLKIICEKANPNSSYIDVDSFKKYKIFLISATIDMKIRSIINFLMKGFKSVGFKCEKKDNKENNDNEENEETVEETPINLRQFFCKVYDEFRLIHLICFLYSQRTSKTIIFFNNCDSVDFHVNIIENLKFNNEILLKNIKFVRIHGKMKHEERLKVFKEFNNTSNNIILLSTDIIARGLDFPNVEWIIHYDINPNKKDYLNRMGRTARMTNSGNSLLFLMEHELKLLDTNLKSFKMESIESESILIRFIKEYNTTLKENEKLPTNSMDWKGEIDVNEEYRKKYSFIIFPFINTIKEYLHSEESLVGNSRKAFKCSLRAYTTYRKYAPEIFNLNTLHLTRYARAFGLYKESLKYKMDDQEYRVDQRSEKNKTKSEKKFFKAQKNMEISEFM